MDCAYHTIEMTTRILSLARNSSYSNSGSINIGCYIVGTRYRSRRCKLGILSKNYYI